MPTSEQIAKFMEDNDDFFGTTRADLFAYLEWRHARKYAVDTYREAVDQGTELWTPAEIIREVVINEMRQYMKFALGKAEDHRGLSANRSILHFRAWMFLLDDHEGIAFADDEANYPSYGVPILRWICKKYDFPFPDDEPWARGMASGEGCEPDCQQGCTG